MAKFTLKRSTIKVTDDENNSFQVRGLSPNDIVQLLDIHRPIMEKMFEQFSGTNPELLMVETKATEDIAAAASHMAIGMIEQAPSLVAHVIALAADDVSSYDDYVLLPMGVQIDAIGEIGKLTFESAGGPKKLWDLAAGILQAKARSSKVA